MAGQDATAGAVETALLAVGDETELVNIRKRLAPDEPAIGMRMRDLFDTAKAFAALPLSEVNALLDHPAYEPRMAAMCILDFQARGRLDDAARRERFQLYLDRHDRITTWDMVDRSAPRVVGGYLAGRSPAPLRKLARATQPLRRRTAITAPLYFIRAGTDEDVETGFSIAGLLPASVCLSCGRLEARAPRCCRRIDRLGGGCRGCAVHRLCSQRPTSRGIGLLLGRQHVGLSTGRRGIDPMGAATAQELPSRRATVEGQRYQPAGGRRCGTRRDRRRRGFGCQSGSGPREPLGIGLPSGVAGRVDRSERWSAWSSRSGVEGGNQPSEAR